MESIIIALIGALTGSVVSSIIVALLQRKCSMFTAEKELINKGE